MNGSEGFWIFMVVLVTFGFVREIVRMKYGVSPGGSRFRMRFGGPPTPMAEPMDSRFLERLDKLEKRVANLEAIIIEQDKRREYDDLRAAV